VLLRIHLVPSRPIFQPRCGILSTRARPPARSPPQRPYASVATLTRRDRPDARRRGGSACSQVNADERWIQGAGRDGSWAWRWRARRCREFLSLAAAAPTPPRRRREPGVRASSRRVRRAGRQQPVRARVGSGQPRGGAPERAHHAGRRQRVDGVPPRLLGRHAIRLDHAHADPPGPRQGLLRQRRRALFDRPARRLAARAGATVGGGRRLHAGRRVRDVGRRRGRPTRARCTSSRRSTPSTASRAASRRLSALPTSPGVPAGRPTRRASRTRSRSRPIRRADSS